MQNKENFEGAKTYLKSFFRTPQLGRTEFNERKNLLSALLLGWRQQDALKLFYEVLFWSTNINPDKQNCFWSSGWWHCADSPLHIVQIQGEALPRIYDNYLHWEDVNWEEENLVAEYVGLINQYNFYPYFGFMFWQSGVDFAKGDETKNLSHIHFECSVFEYFEPESCHEGWCQATDTMHHNLSAYVTELPYKQENGKILFKGQKYFLLAIRYFFRVFCPQNIPSLRQIKKCMLKNNLPNPFPTFWVR